MLIKSKSEVAQARNKLLTKHKVLKKQIPLCKSKQTKDKQKKQLKKKPAKPVYSKSLLKDLSLLSIGEFSEKYLLSVTKVKKLRKECRLQKGWMWEESVIKDNLSKMTVEEVAKLYRLPFVGARAFIQLNKRANENAAK